MGFLALNLASLTGASLPSMFECVHIYIVFYFSGGGGGDVCHKIWLV